MTPRRYGFSGNITGAATKTVWSVTATAAVRPAIYEILMSSNAVPADSTTEWWLLKYGTAAGTNTAVTPQAIDASDPAAVAVCGKNHSVEPTTYGTVPALDFAFNQRATFRWVAVPGSEPTLPATANNGWGLQCQAVAGTPVAVISSVLFME